MENSVAPVSPVATRSTAFPQRAAAEHQPLVRVTGDDALPVGHEGHAAAPDVDAADYVVEGVVFVDAHYVEGGFAVLLHWHPHSDPQLALVDSGGVGGQIVRLLQKGEEIAVQAFRRAVDPLEQPAVQSVKSNRMKLIDLRRFLQHRHAVRRGRYGVGARSPRPLRIGGGHRAHPGVAGNGHHAVRQHVDVGLHRLCRLPGHRLKAVQ